MRKGPNPRRTNGSRRDALRRRVRAMGAPCHLCGEPLDYSLPHFHPMAYELDEIVPVSKGGSSTDPANVAPAHRCCNQERGNMSMEQWGRYRALLRQGVPRKDARKLSERGVLPSAAALECATLFPTSREW